MVTRTRVTGVLVAVGILAAGIGLATVDSLRHRADVRADVRQQAQARADEVADALTQLSRESRTLAAASRDDGFTAAVDAVRARNDAVLGGFVLDDWVLTRVALPTIPSAVLSALQLTEGTEVATDDLPPEIEGSLRAVLERDELRLVGPLAMAPLPIEVTMLADRAPAVDGRPDQRMLVMFLDLDEVLAASRAASTQGLQMAVRVDGGVEGIPELGPTVVDGAPEAFADAVVASADVAGVVIDVAARPRRGWPVASPATALILAPTLLGAALGLIVVERRRTERARLHAQVHVATGELRAAQVRERAVIEHSPDGLLDVEDDRVIAVNPAGAALLGRPADDVVGQRLDDLVAGLHAPDREGDEGEVEVGSRTLQVRSSVVPAGPAAGVRRIVTLHDVTAERRSARLLLRYTRKLEQVNAQYDELEAVRSDLVAKVSHEIRTPLTVISGVTELLDRVDDERRARLVAALGRQVERLTEQVEGLLGLAETARPTAASDGEQAIDLADIARQVVRELDLDGSVQGSALALVDADGARRMLRALLVNARTYGAVPIEVVVGSVAGAAHCDVRDAGPGVADGVDPFVPFAQGTQGDQRTSRGLGIGLAAARGLARAVGGDVLLLSPAAPTVFRLTLPAHRPAPAGSGA